MNGNRKHKTQTQGSAESEVKQDRLTELKRENQELKRRAKQSYEEVILIIMRIDRIIAIVILKMIITITITTVILENYNSNIEHDNDNIENDNDLLLKMIMTTFSCSGLGLEGGVQGRT